MDDRMAKNRTQTQKKNPFRFVRFPFSKHDNVVTTNHWKINLPKGFRFIGGSDYQLIFRDPVNEENLGTIIVKPQTVKLCFANMSLIVDREHPMEEPTPQGFFIEANNTK
jgi:hypothetical protein